MSRFAVDVDGYLCKGASNWPNYAQCEPIQENIDRVNLLSEKHEVVLYTARRQEDAIETIEWLKKHGVKYHNIIFDKLEADYYIDDRAHQQIPKEFL
jgi:uncharacterized HAD superfamily protein